MRRIWLGSALAVVAVAACTGLPTPSSTAVLSVVTTSTVFADFVTQVGGERVTVHALVPRGADVHTFDPSPADARAIDDADLIFMNGLGLDDWLVAVVREAGAQDTPLVQLAVDLPGVEYLAGEDADGAANPHLWLNAAYARSYVARVSGELIALDASGAAEYQANLADYDRRLAELDTTIRADLGAIQPANRRVVSFHDAFPYFAHAYGLEMVGVVVGVPGQEPSAGELARLIEEIRRTGARAILAEAQFGDRLVQTIAAETGATVVADLYDDSLGDAPVDSYEGMMRWNASRIAEALR